MTRPALPHALAAKRFAYLVLLSAGACILAESRVAGQPPAKADVPDLKLRWKLEVTNPPDSATPRFDQEGNLLILASRGGFKFEAISFNPRTGKPGPELKAGPGSLPFPPSRTFTLEKGKFAFQPNSSGEKSLLVWDPANGKSIRTPFPTVGTGFPLLKLSPSGRYIAVGESIYKDGQVREAPFKLIDGKTNKTVVSFDCTKWTALYTADSSRVLVVDSTDRFRWFKLPSGQADGEWKFDREAGLSHANVQSMSADGRVILYYGVPAKGTLGLYLLDGTTGAILHTFPEREHNPHGMCSLSPNGEMVALIRLNALPGQYVEVLSAKGVGLGKVKLDLPNATNRTNTLTSVSWEAGALAMYDYESKTLWVYDLPGGGATAEVVVRPRRDPEGRRDPIPGDAATAKAEDQIRQILKDEYTKKSAADQKTLAQKLIQLASETTDDPASRYVMLRDARDFAQGAADPTLTLQAIEALARWYQIDAPVQQLAALEKILATTTAVATAKAIADIATASAQAATLVDELDEAVEFSQLAVNATKKAKLGAAIDEAEFNLAQAKKFRESFAAVRPALERVQSMPDDPSANLIVGKYRCFVQSRWEDGLKHLAKGEDAALKAVAELDLKAPRAGVPDDAKVADGWWEYAQSAPADTRWFAQARTRYWYAKCLPSLTGLNKVKAEGRLGILVDGIDYRPGLICEFTSRQPAILKGKKARLDPVIDFSAGEFSEGTKQTEMTAKWTGVITPPRGGRYTLVAQTTSAVRVRVNNRLVIDATSAPTAKREAAVILGEQVTPIIVELFGTNTDRNKIKLAWVPPGGTAEEAIPAECFFHDRKTENLLGP